MKNKFKSSSRSKTPWDDAIERTPIESFIRSEYKDHFAIHHPTIKDSREIELLNSYELSECKYCYSTRIKKCGHTKTGVQKYKCNDCNSTFCITTNTIFADHKIPITEWIEFILNLLNYSSNSLNSKTNKNSDTTTKYWIHKVFKVLEDYQDTIILKGDVMIDETYYSVIKSEIQYKNGKKLRGISNNKFCIAMGCDNHGQIYAVIEGKGKPSVSKTRKAYINHIEAKSMLIHDDEHSHSVLVEELTLTSCVHSTKETKGISDKDNPLKQINHYCFLLKDFLDAHSGFDRDDLQNYLNVFVFIMSNPKDKLEKVKILLDLSLKSPKKLRYRDFYNQKG